MRIIHIVHGKANPNGHNGISRVVYHLNKHEKLLGCQSEIWAIVDDAKSHYTYARDEYVTIECYPRVRFPFGKHKIIEDLINQKDSIDIVHFHLIWFYDKNIIAKALNKSGIKFIITTHGTYSTNHAFTGKRRIARILYELAYLKMATEIHTLTREEGTGLMRYGYYGPSFVVPNGVDSDEIPIIRDHDYFKSKIYSNKDIFAWIGVLRDDKNIVSLIYAVSMLPSDIKNQFVCVMIGPDYNNNKSKYVQLADTLDCKNNFDWIGPLYEAEKYNALQSATAFIMPSISEGFSMAILDAMACAKPMILTRGCNLNYYNDNQFYVPCEPYPQDIARALHEFYLLRPRWEEYGKVALDLTRMKLNWTTITKDMVENYERIIAKQY